MIKADNQPLIGSAEQEEMIAVLQSERFARAPNLARMLQYLCERYFEGATFVKEYDIAVAALGRSVDFDPQQDAIVRVNAHQLRKRLREYYEREGLAHQLHIVLPVGQYIPRFVPVPAMEEVRVVSPAIFDAASNEAAVVAPAADDSPAVRASAGEEASHRRPGFRFQLVAWSMILLIVAAVVVSKWKTHAGDSGAQSHPSATQPLVDDAAVRIAAGSKRDVIDMSGRRWRADTYYQGGSEFHREVRHIAGVTDPVLFHTGREGQFRYDIPVAPGTYEIHLHFAETAVNAETFRNMAIRINGGPDETLDVVSDAGGREIAVAKVFTDIQPAKDGKIHLEFRTLTLAAFVNAIEVLPGIRGKMRPVRQTARSTFYLDEHGSQWSPDQWYVGGRSSHSGTDPGGPESPGIFEAERYGHFTYAIPVVKKHRYSVTLYFQENWFGAGRPGKGGVGSRIFDVMCNGMRLLDRFDVLREAGGPSKPVVRRFQHIDASPQGKLVLSFIPQNNYAVVDAIEIQDEGEPLNVAPPAS